MRLVSLFFSLLFLCTVLSAQKKYLVSPNDEVIPLRRGESAAQAIAKRTGIGSPSSSACGIRFTFGYPEEKFPANSNFGAMHKDVMAEWFQLPATGTIDTIFWEVLGAVGALDSTIYVRVHRSRIGPTYGPGANGSAVFRAPCQSWGYYNNTNDLDRKVTGFIDDATDTNWVSTIGPGSVTGAATLPPTIGNSLWGGVLGIAHVQHTGQINYQDMLEYDTLKVVKGDLIWLSQKVKGPVGHTVDGRTEWAANGFRVTLDNENYPARDWKFYEHDSGPSNCAGQNANSVSRGWVARGGFGDDSLDVAVFNYWYSMTVTSNVPPDVKSTDVQTSTFSTGPFPIEAEIEDCDPSDPPGQVVTAVLEWSVDNVSQTPISMSPSGGDFWEGEIPAQECGQQVTYRVKATDDKGEFGTGTQITFSVVCYGSASYAIDTGASCTNRDISTTGTAIPMGAFFLPPTAAANAIDTDDGTAGPFDLGGNMTLFGGGYRYAWISVNGAIALSANATDTLDVNSNGAFTPGWTFPYGNILRTGRDTSASVMARMPINFMAISWNDLIVADTLGTQFGNIRYQQLGGADTCIWVAEWDSVAAFGTGSTGLPDDSRYRIVLNRCDGTIEYQYDNVGQLGLDTTALVGGQGQTNFEYVFLNQFGYPLETRPRNNWCVRFYPSTGIVALDSWNMVSVGVNAVGGDYSKSATYPTAQGPLFAYSGAYVATDPLSNGPGYWAKFNGAGQIVGGWGTLLSSLNIPVTNNWNLIGSIGHPVATSSIGVAGGTVASNYFGYGEPNPAYSVATVILPGKAYWVKMNGAGTLSMNYPGAAPKQSPATDLNAMNRITIVDAAGREQSLYIGEETTVREPLSFFELPPSAPGFDARYSSGRMVETYPANLDKDGVYEYPVVINEAAYPVSIRWNTVKPAGRSLVLTSADGKNTVMNGSGSVRLTDASVKSVVVRLADVQLPTKYALGQNYPNPFNPTTRFDVAIPKLAHVTVAIYDVLGRQITTLMSGEQGAGLYTMEWDGRDARGLNVPTGIYFIRMLADEFNQTQKIMLMK